MDYGEKLKSVCCLGRALLLSEKKRRMKKSLQFLTRQKKVSFGLVKYK